MEDLPDALPFGIARGRGARINPGNRFEGLRLAIAPSELEARALETPEGRQVATAVVADGTRSIVNAVDSPDLSFKWTLNPYRGCEHGCSYCYARPTHEMLGYSCGLDFETKIVAKDAAPRLLREFLARPAWRGEPIVMSGVTDAYQPVERRRRITRRCLEVMADCGQPVSIVTKSRLVVRDLDLLKRLADVRAVRVAVSVTTLDPTLASRLEPRASAPADRLRTIRELADAGVPVSAMVAPIIPALNESEIPAILHATAEAGARRADWVMLRLPHQVRTLFLHWLAEHVPDRAARVERAIRDVRAGALNDAGFGSRGRGVGPRAEQIKRTFDVFRTRCGLDAQLPPLCSDAFRHPSRDGQRSLFEVD